MVTSITNSEDRRPVLEKLIYETIPLGKAMKLRVTQLSTNDICIEAPVADTNANIHNTAFAGSIYSICALSAWSLIHDRLLVENISADVVLAQAEIQYLLPITNCISASCSIDEEEYQDFQNRLLEKGKGRFAIKVNAQEKDELQATLEASIAVKIV